MSTKKIPDKQQHKLWDKKNFSTIYFYLVTLIFFLLKFVVCETTYFLLNRKNEEDVCIEFHFKTDKKICAYHKDNLSRLFFYEYQVIAPTAKKNFIFTHLHLHILVN